MTSNSDVVLSSIAQKLREVERLITVHNCFSNALTLLEDCKSNMERIRHLITPNVFNGVKIPIDQLLHICSSSGATNTPTATDTSFSPAVNRSGRKGRPYIDITHDQLKLLHRKGYTARQMAAVFKCSTQLVYRRLYASGIRQRHKYTSCGTSALQQIVKEIHKDHPESGCKMMVGYLRATGQNVQRERVRHALKTVDPIGTATRWAKTVSRRVYTVAMPNSLWHVDSHMKLIRWGFATHGCVDGYSRMVVFLRCCTSNTGEEVAQSFLTACNHFGLPQRVRCDHGMGNFHVGIIMNILRGQNRGSIITGQSVHNQRIERLWRDVFKDVASHFYADFYRMEDRGILLADDPVHRCALQITYLPVINSRLSNFQRAWNSHNLRSEHHKTPEQLWLNGMLAHSYSSSADGIFNITESPSQQLFSYLTVNALLPVGYNTAGQNTVGWHTDDIHLTPAQLQLVQNAMTDNTCDENRYLQCLNAIENLLG